MKDLKQMPSDTDTEEAVLCALLMAPERRGEANSKLTPAEFWDSRNRTLFEAVRASDGDIIAIHAALESHTPYPGKGTWKEYLFRIGDIVSTSAGLTHHIEILKTLAKRRTLITLAAQIDSEARTADPEELISTFHGRLTALEMQDLSRPLRGVHLGNVYTAERALKSYAEYVDSLQHCRFITGIRPIDRYIRGVGPGEVLSIIARAGTFKTALLQNLLLNYISNSAWAGVLYSLEMPVASITERYGQMIDGCTGQGIESQYTQEGAELFREDFEKRFKEKFQRLYIIPSRVSLQDIIRYTDLIQREFKVKIGVIGIDYLGLIDAPSEKEYELVSKLARGVKDLAKFTNVPVIDLVQTSRKAGTGETEIEMDMGRGSGAIEEAADFVLGLFTPEEGKVVCKVLKNRKGRKGKCWSLDLNTNTFKIGPEAEEWEAPKKNSKREPSWQE